MKFRSAGAVASASLVLAGALACESVPGDREEQGAVIGGAAGAAVGAAVSSENRLLGALLGGALGAGAGYVIGAKTDWFEDEDRDHSRERARKAAEDARTSPATVEDVRDSNTADLNDDGFVTTDELVAMEAAGLGDDEILDRLRATDQVFDLSRAQEERLLQAGVSPQVVYGMRDINSDERRRLLSDPEVIGAQ